MTGSGLGLLLIPAGWIVFYALTGTYHSLYKKSRLNEFSSTALSSLIGCTILFFAIVINDPQTDYRYYYKAYFTFPVMHFLITWTARWIILYISKMQIRKGEIVFKSLLLGSGKLGKNLYDTVSGFRAKRISIYRVCTTEFSDDEMDIGQFPAWAAPANWKKSLIDQNISLS